MVLMVKMMETMMMMTMMIMIMIEFKYMQMMFYYHSTVFAFGVLLSFIEL